MLLAPKLIPVVVACAALLGATASSSAATVQVQFDSNIFNGVTNPSHDTVKITYPPLSGSNPTTATVAAGRFQGTVKSFSSDVNPIIFVDGVDDLFMYCYDVYENIGGNWLVNYTINFSGALPRTLDFLGAVNSVLNQGKAVEDDAYDKFAWLHPGNGFVAAAVQLGIWESRYESDGWDIGDGVFKATGIEAGTSVWLTSFFDAIGSTPSLEGRYVMTLEAAGAQDMITGDPPAQVPEPDSLALVAAAGLGLLAARRKTAAKQRTTC